MKTSDTNHLSEDQIIIALVDETDLPDDRRTHLSDCPHCRQVLEAAKEPFERIEALAGDHTPGSMRPVRIDGQRPARPRSLSWRTGLAWTTAAAVLLAMIWAGPWVRDLRRPENEGATAALDPEALFMAEVARLGDDPLPDLDLPDLLVTRLFLRVEFCLVLGSDLGTNFLLNLSGKRCDDSGEFLQSLPVCTTLRGDSRQRRAHRVALLIFAVTDANKRRLAGAALVIKLQPFVQGNRARSFVSQWCELRVKAALSARPVGRRQERLVIVNPDQGVFAGRVAVQ